MQRRILLFPSALPFHASRQGQAILEVCFSWRPREDAAADLS